MTAAPDITSVREWLIAGAPDAATPNEVIAEMCKRIAAAGIPLWRAALFVRTLHPQIMGRRIEWRQDGGVRIGEASYEVFDTASFRDSPVVRVYEEVRPLRLRLDDPEARAFPQLDDLRAEGGTDYLAVPIQFTNGEVHVGTWTTRQPGGFRAAQCAALETLSAPLARVTEAYALRRTATNLLDTYVGREAGAHPGGEHPARLHRGDPGRDLALGHARLYPAHGLDGCGRGDRPAQPLFRLPSPGHRKAWRRGAQIHGRRLAGNFPARVDADPRDVCQAALAAAAEVRHAITVLADWPASGPRYGVALHIGDVLYGNIGAANRLDFTCIGPAVNLASRLEELTGRLKRTTVLSAEFARHCGVEVARLGEFALDGLREPQPVFGLADEPA